MSRRIQSLSPQLASQIAAGEVVERPASVVKELLENSIDAGADRIELELDRGGLKRIHVCDNGAGIHPEDLPLALAQHATSKIYSRQELDNIASLGFRGEALASIASVSRFTLCSFQPGQPHAWQIRCDGGKALKGPLACALERGTRIEVHDLFYNTPARRKFMRSERTEYLHVEEVLKRLALSRYDIAFSLSHNGRQVLRLRAAPDDPARRRRIAEVVGQGFMREALQVDFQAAGLRLWGYLSPPEHSVAQSGSQYFYLNGRMIRDRLVSHAIRQAHLEVLAPGRYPAYVLYLDIDPDQVDINVHPTKHEVRFRQTRLVHDFLHRALANALRAEAESPVQDTPEDTRSAPAYAGTGSSPARPDKAAIAEQHHFYRQATALRAAPQPIPPVNTQGQVLLHGRYLLCTQTGVPRLLDIQRLRREVWLEQLQQAWASEAPLSIPLLVPEVVSLTPGQVAELVRRRDVLSRLGLAFTELGPDSVALRQLPPLMRGMPVPVLLARLLEVAPATNGGDWQQALIERLLPLAPAPSLIQAVACVQHWEGWSGRDAPWRPVSESALQHWLEHS